ncbi:hypothetical protein [Haloferula sp.]|uniref:hypothetical protein n=1 Tax=Haloferula sp. TaxID=2497595 RepID=UPI00329CB3A5
MPNDDEPSFFDGWGFLNQPTQIAFILIYNGTSVAILFGLWGHDHMVKVLLCTAGYMALLFLLLLRTSEWFRNLVVKPERNTPKLVSSLKLPIIFWVFLSVLFSLIPSDIW